MRNSRPLRSLRLNLTTLGIVTERPAAASLRIQLKMVSVTCLMVAEGSDKLPKALILSAMVTGTEVTGSSVDIVLYNVLVCGGFILLLSIFWQDGVFFEKKIKSGLRARQGRAHLYILLISRIRSCPDRSAKAPASICF